MARPFDPLSYTSREREELMVNPLCTAAEEHDEVGYGASATQPPSNERFRSSHDDRHSNDRPPPREATLSVEELLSLDVKITDARHVKARSGSSYVTYEINCTLLVDGQRRESRVRRRYSQFVALNNELVASARAAGRGAPPRCLPPKRFIGVISPRVVKERRNLLEEYLQALRMDEHYRSQPQLHGFLGVEALCDIRHGCGVRGRCRDSHFFLLPTQAYEQR